MARHGLGRVRAALRRLARAGEHAESPDTKRRLKNLLDATGLTERLVVLPPRAGDRRGALPRPRPRGYVERIRELSAGRGGDAGSEAPFGNGSFEIAALAAGGTITAIDAVLDGASTTPTRSCGRPATMRCPTSAWASASSRTSPSASDMRRRSTGVGRVAVVDWDVHHGNGTQAVFWEDALRAGGLASSGRPLPGGLGLDRETGAGAGSGATLNVPLPAGSGTGAYLDALDRVVVPALGGFQAGLIVIACGFDAGGLDPLGRMLLPASAFGTMAARLLEAANWICEGRLVPSHEGGYSVGHVPFCGARGDRGALRPLRRDRGSVCLPRGGSRPAI